MNTKPLFIPLKKEYYEAFERGEKHTEYRKYGPRWNESTCYPGRKAILSCGYGKQRRMEKRIIKAHIVTSPEVSVAFKQIYGTDQQCFAIVLEDLEAAPLPNPTPPGK